MLPFATEEAWSWSHDTSVHARGVAGGHRRRRRRVDLDVVSEVLATVRRAKTEAKQSQRASVARSTVTVPAATAPALEAARADLVDALTVVELDSSTAPSSPPTSTSAERIVARSGATDRR